MLKSRLGFGMMRLPVIGGDPTIFDYEKLFEMVDTFMDAGYEGSNPSIKNAN